MKTLGEQIEDKDEAFEFIIDLGFDYDGYEESKDLKGLIDELVSIAKIGLNKDK